MKNPPKQLNDRSLIGKRILITDIADISNRNNIREAMVLEVSPSGRLINLRQCYTSWVNPSAFILIEELE